MFYEKNPEIVESYLSVFPAYLGILQRWSCFKEDSYIQNFAEKNLPYFKRFGERMKAIISDNLK